MLGGIAAVTDPVKVQTGVTCPTVRYHPAIVAQMVATAASLMEGRFALGIGSGENLNEHILGDRWPPATVRIDMMREAIDVIRTLWQGEVPDYYGTYYLVEKARIVSLPGTLPEVIVSAMGPISAKVAAEMGDQMIHYISDPLMVTTVLGAFKAAGGLGKPCNAELSFCFHEDEAKAREIAYTSWPIAADVGELNWLLPSWSHYEQLQRMVTPDRVARKIVCGPDIERFVGKIREIQSLEFTRISVHQAGPEQEKFLAFAEEELLPQLR